MGLAQIGIPVATSVIGGILGGKDKWDMSPEQRKYLEYLWGELQKPQGYSPAEKRAMEQELKIGLQGQAEERTGRDIASLGRRGLLSPGQASGMAVETSANYGKQYGRGKTAIGLASAAEGRRRKGFLESLIAGASAGQYMPEDNSWIGGLGDLSSTLSYYLNMPKGGGIDFTNLYGLGRPQYKRPTFNWGGLSGVY